MRVLHLSRITYFGQEVLFGCDARCSKAWGINNRPTMQLNVLDEDDYLYLADDELGTAPDDPGTWEGGHSKPTNPLGFPVPPNMPNKWCVRECERGVIGGDVDDVLKRMPCLHQLREFNMHWRSSATGSIK